MSISLRGAWKQLLEILFEVSFFSAETTSKVRVSAAKEQWHQSAPGLNLESLLKEISEFSLVSQQNYKALHRNLGTPPKRELFPSSPGKQKASLNNPSSE